MVNNASETKSTAARKSFLLCVLHTSHYALRADVVREIVFLPEIQPVEEVPPYISGVINLRGRVVPVMDLDIRFGHPPRPAALDDKLIFIEAENRLLGVMVSDVLDVVEIAEADMETAPPYISEKKHHPHFISGEAKVGERIVMLLDHRNLVKMTEEVETAGEMEHTAEPLPSGERPEEKDREKLVFRERAINLMRPMESEDLTDYKAIAVISLNGERFGTELSPVREFAEISGFTPVPSTPPHVVGCMNLRGEALPLVDIRGFLDMNTGNAATLKKVVVADFNGILAGISVEDVIEVIYTHESDIGGVPASVTPSSRDLFKGSLPYGGKMIGVLDIEKILSMEEIIVDEEV